MGSGARSLLRSFARRAAAGAARTSRWARWWGPRLERGIGRALPVLALAIVVLALLLPVGALFLQSFQVEEVVTTDGRVVRALGEVRLEEGRIWKFAIPAASANGRTNVGIPRAQVAQVRTVFSLDHYERVFADARTLRLVTNSLLIAAGGVLVSLLLGLPLAWLLFRTDLAGPFVRTLRRGGRRFRLYVPLPGRGLLGALVLAPAILPPFFVAMGGARRIGNALHDLLGLTGGTLQLVNAMVVFGCVFFPLVVLLVGRALAAVPMGAWEAALMLGGRRAALTRVVLPAVLPAVLGSAVLVFVLAWSDFGVPDLLGFMLPAGATPVHVFPTEILLQWKQQGNTGRAVATGAPLVLVTLAFLLLALFLLRRSPVVDGGEGRRGRPRRSLGLGARTLGWLFVAGVLALTLVLPLVGVAGWADGGGESVARGAGAQDAPASRGSLFDFSQALANTTNWEGDASRWIRSGLGAALLAMFVSVVLVRWAGRRGRAAKGLVVAIGALPLAVPGLVFTVGTLLLWIRLDVPGIERTVVRSVLVLTARFLPFALLAAWLALREVRRGHEEAAALLGAGPLRRGIRIWFPLSARGILGGGLIVLVLALREIEAVILVDPRIFPLRLYDKIHFSRLADEANLAFLYVGTLLVPAILAAVLLGARRRHRG